MLNDCKHCNATGTCSSGVDGASCLDCAKKTYAFSILRKRKTLESNVGLVCKQCEGSGVFDPASRRLHNNIKPVLGLVIVFISLFMVHDLADKGNQYFEQVLPFVSTLVGTVVAYYFTRDKGSEP